MTDIMGVQEYSPMAGIMFCAIMMMEWILPNKTVCEKQKKLIKGQVLLPPITQPHNHEQVIRISKNVALVRRNLEQDDVSWR